MTLTTTTRARIATSASAPRINLRRGLFVNDRRSEPRPAPKSTWIGTLVVQR